MVIDASVLANILNQARSPILDQLRRELLPLPVTVLWRLQSDL